MDRSQVPIDVGFVGGELSDSHFPDNWGLSLRIKNIFQGELTKELQVPHQAGNTSLSPFCRRIRLDPRGDVVYKGHLES